MDVLALVELHKGSIFSFGGNSYWFVPDSPVSDQEIADLKDRMVPRLPEDYVQFLKTYGYADVFGAKLHRPMSVMRYEGDLDLKKPAHSFVQFAKRAPLLFAFHVELVPARDLATKASWPDATDVSVVKGERLTGSFEYANLAPSFTEWVSMVITMCQTRAAAAGKA